MRLKDYIIDSKYRKNGYFSPGYITQEADDAVPEGTIIDGLNWIVKKDKVELRRGQYLMGTDDGTGKVTGLRVARKIDGSDFMFKTRERKIEYYDDTTEDWIEIGTNSLPSDASGEDIAIEPYTSLAGYMMYFSSPNSGIYKIMLANPGSLIDMSSNTFRGKIKIRNGRMFLWDRKGSTGSRDKTGVYGSNLDKDEYSDFTQVTNENVGTGDGTTKTFTDTLAFKAAGAKRSCFGVTATDGTETFNDNFDGTLTGDKGGTGTINYATGAISLTFNTAPNNSQAITSDYYWEDPTSTGICDFSYSATRVASEGFVIRQDDGGGDMQNIGHYNGDYYCLHEKRAWKLTISADDSEASNLPFRDKAGIPNWRAMAETGEGIYYIDESDDNDVRIRLLRIGNLNTEVIPVSISDNIDLSDYRFDYAVSREWGDYMVFACRRSSASQNDRIFFYNRRLKLWNPPTDYQAHCLEVYDGALMAGDSTTNNVYELMSGYDDDDSLINNHITFNQTNLGVEGLKRPHRFIVAGEIQPDQLMKIYLSVDEGKFVQIGEIEGDGDYVDQGASVAIGAQVIGKKEVGGGGDGETANPYQREINILNYVDKFEKVKVKFEATKIGYCSVKRYGFKDIRYKGKKLPNKYL